MQKLLIFLRDVLLGWIDAEVGGQPTFNDIDAMDVGVYSSHRV